MTAREFIRKTWMMWAWLWPITWVVLCLLGWAEWTWTDARDCALVAVPVSAAYVWVFRP